ncbi:MAG: alpha-keto acid decarboxylase family protein [Candidatus Riflebacteria bacterium]|nr:alpha-keto acid decarboxylase family protein [Candidatus Riflebacteria bacterium]
MKKEVVVADTCTVSRYLLRRLEEVGIGHLFGVPGDYVLDFLDEVLASPIRWIGTCNELNAGYAADGYARMAGAGAAVVTYGVGGLSILNAVAGAYAERVPLIIISGAPPSRHRDAGSMVHHLISDYYLQLEIFKKLTVDAAILTSPETAPAEIDRVIQNGIAKKLPVYLELPADLARAPCSPPAPTAEPARPRTDAMVLKDCVEETAELINRSSSPVVLAGVELLRFSLGSAVLQLVERVELPFATTVSSKSVLPELHPQFIGLYQGAWSRDTVRRQVESADCLLSLGVWRTDLDTGLFSFKIDPRRTIAATENQVCIRNHYYHGVRLDDFVRELTSAVRPRSYLASHPAAADHARRPFEPDGSRALTAPRLYDALDSFLDDQMVLLAEPGDAFCAAPEFHIEEAQNFIVQAYYCSIGFCTPAALGVSLARPGKRPVVLTGDGAFQMTAQEVSTMIRQRCPAIVLLLNNDGYLIERVLHEDGAYNDVQMWNYSGLPAVFGGSETAIGIRVTTEGELAHALATAAKERDKLVFIDLYLANRDCSRGLARLGQAFRQAQRKR